MYMALFAKYFVFVTRSHKKATANLSSQSRFVPNPDYF